MTPAEQKEAEAIGSDLKEVKAEIASDTSSEVLPSFQKRSRRKECIYITTAVFLGAGLISVLVYFSVANALKADDPVDRKSTGDEYSTTESTTPYDSIYDYQSEMDNSFGGDDPSRSNANLPSPAPGAGSFIGLPQSRDISSNSGFAAPQSRDINGASSETTKTAAASGSAGDPSTRMRSAPRARSMPAEESAGQEQTEKSKAEGEAEEEKTDNKAEEEGGEETENSRAPEPRGLPKSVGDMNTDETGVNE